MTYDLTWLDHKDEDEDEVDLFAEHRISLSWSTMGRICRAMLIYGMAYPSDPGPCPDDPSLLDKWFRCAGVEERPGIPAHKLSSNDEWEITPLEIRGALLASDVRDIVQSEPMWVPWIDWLESAIDHGGAVAS